MDPVHDRGSMDPVQESGPWTRSKVGLRTKHGPEVHGPIKISIMYMQRSLHDLKDSSFMWTPLYFFCLIYFNTSQLIFLHCQRLELSH